MRNDIPDSRERSIGVPHGEMKFPLFLPDATFGAVRSVDSADLEGCGIQAVVMNVFHLMQNPGSSVIQRLGGLHKFAGWDRPIVTDSGGYQAYSLIRRDPSLGGITKRGMFFRPRNSSRRFLLTPEKSIQLQLSYGSDVLICLDDCTHVSEPLDSQKESVERTVRWAERCKTEFMKRNKLGHASTGVRPLLFGVVQGGGSHELRRSCAESLLEIGFDGFGYGGYPLDNKGNLLTEMLGFTRKLIPPEFPMIALGVGEPSNVIRCMKVGYQMFDSSLPTRDARQGRLYAFKENYSSMGAWREESYDNIYVKDKKHVKNGQPISPYCDCLACTRYSAAFLHHLFNVRDPLYYRLATIHNLRFMTLLMRDLKGPYNEEQRFKE